LKQVKVKKEREKLINKLHARLRQASPLGHGTGLACMQGIRSSDIWVEDFNLSLMKKNVDFLKHCLKQKNNEQA
jgi:hypothetical protein